MQHERRALVLVGLGLAVVLGTVLVGTLTAPSLSTMADGNRSTLVGSQSVGGGWDAGGSAFRMEGGDVVWQVQRTNNLFEVSRLDNETIAVAIEDDGFETGCAPYDPPCHKTGFRVLEPSGSDGAEVVSEYLYPIRGPRNSETHAVDRVTEHEFVVADMEHERVFTVANGTITWQWNASELYTPPADPTRTDWLHTNDVDAINETHFLVSVRNANQLVVLERGEGVVEIINEDRDDSNDGRCEGKLVGGADGDVRCGDPTVLNRQHNPQWLGEGAVLVADSHNDRAVELHRNETTGEWEEVWGVGSAAGAGFNWPRDADRLPNGNTLITDTFNSRVVEVAPNGTAVWSVGTFNLPYEADRLPYDEPDDVPVITNGTVADPDSGGIPLFSKAAFGARGEFTFVPVWFEGVHLLAVTVGVLFVLVGAGYGGGAYVWRARQ